MMLRTMHRIKGKNVKTIAIQEQPAFFHRMRLAARWLSINSGITLLKGAILSELDTDAASAV
ncbi:MAG: hypothetical protein HGB04_02245 [Chlorobiaceae bacterium]|nr:hypothetical protein [Chlorobiaceae bacterium]